MAIRRSDGGRQISTLSITIESENETSKLREPRKLLRAFHSSQSYWGEFCNNTSLHGFRYLGESHRPLAERLWWVISISVSIIACAILITKTYRKWDASPVIVSFAETSTPVWHIPFPAVTICSEIKVKRTVLNYTKLMLELKEDNVTDDQMESLQYASLLCTWPFESGNLTIDQDKFLDYIDKVSPSLYGIIIRCFWKGVQTSCSRLFKPIMTDEGKCYTFNSLSANEMLKEDEIQSESNKHHRPLSRNWSMDAGYAHGAKNEYPLRTHSSGSGAGLVFRYTADDKDMDPLCRWPVRGFKVLLHSPLDFPQVGHQFFRVPLNRDVVVGVRPSMMNTSAGLRSYPASRRQCLLSSERQLRFFRIYTQKNCEFECLTNYTMHFCNCTTFFMPHAENASICGAGSSQCVDAVMARLVDDHANTEECACMPACTEVKYDVETSQSDLGWDKFLEFMRLNDGDVSDLETRKFGQISIYFKEMQFISSRRSELFGITEFMANCGGLLGLFIGFSFLSLVEFLYFFTVRLLSNLRTRRRVKHVA